MEVKKKSIMRTPGEKEKILIEMIDNSYGYHTISKKYGISKSTLWQWHKKYQENGIDGLISNTGKSKGGNKGLGRKKFKNREEELEYKLLLKEIELLRLKKGYVVKGVGAKKEYVSLLDVNMK